MVKVKEDLVGKIFGRLTVVKQVDDYIDKKGNHYARWLCGCSCSENKQILVRGSHLTSNKTTSCGCIRKEKLQEVGYIQGRLNKKYNHYEIRSDEYGDYYVGWTSNTNREFYFDIERGGILCQNCRRPDSIKINSAVHLALKYIPGPF